MATVKLNNSCIFLRPGFLKNLLVLVKFLFGVILLLNLAWLFQSVETLRIENVRLRLKLDHLVENRAYCTPNGYQDLVKEVRETSFGISVKSRELLDLRKYVDERVFDLTQRVQEHTRLMMEGHKALAEVKQAHEEKLAELERKKSNENTDHSEVNVPVYKEIEALAKTTSQESSEMRTLYNQIKTKVEEVRLEVFALSEDLTAIADGSQGKIKDKKQIEALLKSYISKDALKAALKDYTMKVSELSSKVDSQNDFINQMKEELKQLKDQDQGGFAGWQNEFVRNFNNFQSSGSGCDTCGSFKKNKNKRRF